MKKYCSYLPVCMLCLIVLLSQLVSSRRNDFSVGLSTIAEQENKAVGDPKEIEDLHYSFYIADAIMNGKSVESGNAWRIDAKGNHFQVTYEPQKMYTTYRYKESEDTSTLVDVRPVYDQETMPISDNVLNCDTYYSDGAPVCSYEADLKQLSYEIVFEQYDTSGKKAEKLKNNYTNTYTLLAKSGKKDIPVTYNEAYIRGKKQMYIRTTFSNGNADDKYGNLKVYEASKASVAKIQDDTYISIGALQFDVNFDMVDFDKDPTGIYKIDKAGKVSQILSMNVKKETILYMTAFKERLAAVVEKNGKLYGHLYSTNGKLLDEFLFEEELNQTNSLMLYAEEDALMYIQEPIYNSMERDVRIYDISDNKLKQIDRMVLAEKQITASDGFMIDAILHYDRTKGILYSIVNNITTLNITAQNKKKVLYSSSLFGDYSDDDKLALADTVELTTANAYEKIISDFLNTQKRNIFDIRLLKAGDDT
ncbi:hypothetical protein MKC73_09410 [[Clostridium] innocuum]|nr:hypothetical protein [[Clostridium] innocuum]